MLPTVRAIVVFLFTIAAGYVSHTCAEEITLEEAYQLAVNHAPDVEIARYGIDVAEAKKDQAFGKILPQASVFGQWSDNKLTYESDSPFYNDADYPGQRYGISIRQTLLGVSDGIEVTRQDLLFRRSQDELRIAEADLLAQVVAAYLDILLSNAEVALLKAELAAVQTQVLESRALYDKSLLPVTQVLETESRRDALTADLIMAEGKTAVAREALFNFTGLRGGEPVEVNANLALLSRFSSPDEVAGIARASDPAIDAAKTTVSAAEKAVLREKSRWIPDISLSYNYQHADVGFDNLSSPPRDTSTLAIDFRYPIFEGGARFARIRGASAEYQTAVTGLRAQELDTEARARSAWIVFDAASERVLSAKKAVNSSSVSVTAVQHAVRAGTARYTDVLLALAQRSRAQRDLEDARFFYARAWTELELSSGASPAAVAAELSHLLHAR